MGPLLLQNHRTQPTSAAIVCRGLRQHKTRVLQATMPLGHKAVTLGPASREPVSRSSPRHHHFEDFFRSNRNRPRPFELTMAKYTSPFSSSPNEMTGSLLPGIR